MFFSIFFGNLVIQKIFNASALEIQKAWKISSAIVLLPFLNRDFSNVEAFLYCLMMVLNCFDVEENTTRFFPYDGVIFCLEILYQGVEIMI